MANALERLITALETTGLDTTKDIDQVPTKLREMLALINDVTEAKLKSDLAGAIRRGEPAGPGLPALILDVPPLIPDPDWQPGRASGADVKRGDIVTLATSTKGVVTVGDIIDDALALQGAMARLMDEYIKLVIREEVKSGSLISSGGEETGSLPTSGGGFGTT